MNASTFRQLSRQRRRALRDVAADRSARSSPLWRSTDRQDHAGQASRPTLYSPDAGYIAWDAVAVSDDRRSDLRRSIAVIFRTSSTATWPRATTSALGRVDDLDNSGAITVAAQPGFQRQAHPLMQRLQREPGWCFPSGARTCRILGGNKTHPRNKTPGKRHRSGGELVVIQGTRVTSPPSTRARQARYLGGWLGASRRCSTTAPPTGEEDPQRAALPGFGTAHWPESRKWQ